MRYLSRATQHGKPIFRQEITSEMDKHIAEMHHYGLKTKQELIAHWNRLGQLGGSLTGIKWHYFLIEA